MTRGGDGAIINKNTRETEGYRLKIKWNKKYTGIALSFACVSCLLILITWLLINLGKVGKAFSTLSSVFLPVILGFIIAYLLNPLQSFLERKIFAFVEKKKPHPWLRRCLSVAAAYLCALILIGVFLICVVPQVIACFNDLTAKAGSYVSMVNGWIRSVVGDSGFLYEEYRKLLAKVDLNRIQEYINEFVQNSSDLMISGGGTLLSFFGSFLGGTLKVILGIFISVYMLLGKEHLTETVRLFLRSVLPVKIKNWLSHVLKEANDRFGGFIVGQLIDALVVGVLVFVSCWILRIPYYPLVSVICAVTNVIPFFGPFLGSIPSFLIIFVADPLKALIFVALILVIQQIDGNYICPHILGSSTGLSSLGVIVAITVMGGLFGITGMFIGVPVFAVLIALISEKIEDLLDKKKLPVTEEAYGPDADPFASAERQSSVSDPDESRACESVRTDGSETEKNGVSSDPAMPEPPDHAASSAPETSSAPTASPAGKENGKRKKAKSKRKKAGRK